MVAAAARHTSGGPATAPAGGHRPSLHPHHPPCVCVCVLQARTIGWRLRPQWLPSCTPPLPTSNGPASTAALQRQGRQGQQGRQQQGQGQEQRLTAAVQPQRRARQRPAPCWWWVLTKGRWAACASPSGEAPCLCASACVRVGVPACLPPCFPCRYDTLQAQPAQHRRLAPHHSPAASLAPTQQGRVRRRGTHPAHAARARRARFPWAHRLRLHHPGQALHAGPCVTHCWGPCCLLCCDRLHLSVLGAAGAGCLQRAARRVTHASARPPRVRQAVATAAPCSARPVAAVGGSGGSGSARRPAAGCAGRRFRCAAPRRTC